MGQKIHPTGFRLPVTRNWSSRWYASNKNFATMLAEDLKVREYLKARLKNAAVSRILIERPAKNARITIYSARPGVVIGKKGEDIENLKAELTRRLGVPVAVNIEEVRKPEIDAQLIADSITQQLEKRIMFRRAMKRAMQNAMRLGAQGIKLMSSGRLNGIEIARSEWYREGRVPLHTLKADIDYGFSEAKTTYGVIGVKCWVYRGDRLANGEAPSINTPAGAEDDRRNRRGPRPGGPGGAPGGRPRPTRPGCRSAIVRCARPPVPSAPTSRSIRAPSRPHRTQGAGCRRRCAQGPGRQARPQGRRRPPLRLRTASPRPTAKENKNAATRTQKISARNRRAATPASPRAAPTCRSATSA